MARTGRATAKLGMKGLRQEYWSIVTKEGMSALTGKWENAIIGKQLDSVQEKTLAVSATEVIVDKKAQSFRGPKAQIQIDGRTPSNGVGSRGESPFRRKGQKGCTNFLKGTCTNLSCNHWHPCVRQNYTSVSGCKFGDQCLFRHTEAPINGFFF